MNRWMRAWRLGLISCLTGLLIPPSASGAQVGLVEIDGAIGPATADYVARATDESGKRGDICVIVRLDTPGGLLDSTNKIVRSFYESKVPVVVYVAPSGAGATSAGCFITLAADVAAMAPGSTIGAAHPVSLGGPGGGEEKSDGVMKEKIENYAASSIEAIATKRGRNAAWAIDAVRKSASVTAEKALELNVVDLLAVDLPELLAKLDGREVRGEKLDTIGAAVVTIPMSARERVFQTLWRPEVMFLLMLIAVYGIIGELSNPGAVLPGVAGALALLLALYMGSVLPVNVTGLAFLALAVALFITDIFAPTHGILTAGGLVAFLLGSFMLFDGTQGVPGLSWTVVLPSAGITAAFFVFIVGAGLRAQRLPVKSGTGAMLGRTAVAHTRIDTGGGTVLVEGELWNALSDTPAEAGETVEITGVKGLTLSVKPGYKKENQ